MSATVGDSRFTIDDVIMDTAVEPDRKALDVVASEQLAMATVTLFVAIFNLFTSLLHLLGFMGGQE